MQGAGLGSDGPVWWPIVFRPSHRNRTVVHFSLCRPDTSFCAVHKRKRGVRVPSLYGGTNWKTASDARFFESRIP